MRYQKDIVERLCLGLAGVSHELSATFRDRFSTPRQTLSIFSNEVNAHYAQLIEDQPKVDAVGVPEHNEDIPYWIDDLERAVLPALRKRCAKCD